MASVVGSAPPTIALARMMGKAPPADSAGPPAADAADWADVRSALAGNGDAFARLVRRHQERIAAAMWRFTRDPCRWEELVHEVFVEAYFSLSTYRGDAPLEHWLRRIATRVGFRWWKERDRRRSEAPLEVRPRDVPTDSHAEAISAREAAEVVHAVLDRLAPRDRLVLTLMYLEECSVAEIAELTGWSRTMVKVQAHRARKRLKPLLHQVGVEP